MEAEERLTIQWLQQRQKFDLLARNARLFSHTLNLLGDLQPARVADIGAGTGNNALSLLDELPAGSKLMLVEQHGYLLRESQRRLAAAAKAKTSVELQFRQQDLHGWLLSKPRVDLICNCALLDLFTLIEMKRFFQLTAEYRIPVYSTLNYHSISFHPTEPNDDYFISLFEQHMCRQLDRGHPLGPKLHTAMTSLVKSLNLCVQSAASHWQINPSERSFLHQNLMFYERGIQTMMLTMQDKKLFERWIRNKQALLNQGRLSLEVRHIDYLVTPMKPK